MTEGDPGSGPNENDLSFIEKIKDSHGQSIYKKSFRYVVDPVARIYDVYRRIFGPIVEHLFALFLLGFSVYEVVSEKKLPEYHLSSNTDQTIAYLSNLCWWLFGLFLVSVAYMVLQNFVSHYKSIVILDRDTEMRAQTLALERKDVVINDLRMEAGIDRQNLEREIALLRADMDARDTKSDDVLNLVAHQFRELEESRQRFDALLLGTISEIQVSRADFQKERLGALRIEQQMQMERIAEAAVTIFNAAKRLPPNETVGFNIKLFSGDNTDPEFSVIVRAGYRNDDRRGLDNENVQKHGRLHVKRHAIYNHLMYGNGRLLPHLCVPDKEVYLKQISRAHRVGGSPFSMPDEYFDSHYRCSLLVPIRGGDTTLLESPSLTGLKPVKVNEDCLLGLICVDFHPRKKFFGTSFDIDVMRQLATHIFNTLRAYHGTVLLCSAISRAGGKGDGTGHVNGKPITTSSRVGAAAKRGRNKASTDNEQQA